MDNRLRTKTCTSLLPQPFRVNPITEVCPDPVKSDESCLTDRDRASYPPPIKNPKSRVLSSFIPTCSVQSSAEGHQWYVSHCSPPPNYHLFGINQCPIRNRAVNESPSLAEHPSAPALPGRRISRNQALPPQDSRSRHLPKRQTLSN